VDDAFAVSLPKNTCMCEAPGWPGNTIGSSAPEWLYGHSTRNCGTRPCAPATGVSGAAFEMGPAETAADPTPEMVDVAPFDDVGLVAPFDDVGLVAPFDDVGLVAPLHPAARPTKTSNVRDRHFTMSAWTAP